MHLVLVIGMTGEGKSNWLNREILLNDIRPVGGNRDNYFISDQSRKQYVFDLNNEYQFPDDTTVKPIMRSVELDPVKFIENCRKCKNTNLVFEDATGILRGRQSADMAKIIVQKRHSGNNIFALFHSINRVPPELLEMCTYVILFKTGDNYNSIDSKFHNDKLNEAFLRLRNKPKFTFEKLKMI